MCVCECALACLRECLCAWNKFGVDHSAPRRDGNESAESSKNKDEPFSNSTGGLGRSKESQEQRRASVCTHPCVYVHVSALTLGALWPGKIQDLLPFRHHS